MKVFDAALQAIVQHQRRPVPSGLDQLSGCTGCGWLGPDREAFEVHLATEIDKLVD